MKMTGNPQATNQSEGFKFIHEVQHLNSNE